MTNHWDFPRSIVPFFRPKFHNKFIQIYIWVFSG